ncbi:MAG: SDR family oxidoreductase [Thermoflexales bacterium]
MESRVALVTGAGSGIGRAVSLALMQGGWRVVLAGRREDALTRTITESGAAAAQALAVPTDLRDPAGISTLFKRTRETFGRLDLLFNNAGISSPGRLEDISLEQWKSVVDTNLTAAFLCTQEAFKIMKAQTPRGGRIINNGSVSAYTPRPDSAPYTATKHAITGLTKSTSLDGRKYDIACGQIDIGNALTDMAARMTRGVAQANGEIAIEPVMDPEHVARAVLNMANLPLDTNVLFMTIMATKMPYVGRG